MGSFEDSGPYNWAASKKNIPVQTSTVSSWHRLSVFWIPKRVRSTLFLNSLSFSLQKHTLTQTSLTQSVKNWEREREREMASNIGMMDSAYFVGRSEILCWINSTLQLNLSKVEEVIKSLHVDSIVSLSNSSLIYFVFFFFLFFVL